MFPIPELIIGKASDIEWVYPHAVNAIDVEKGNTTVYTTGAGVALNNVDRPLYSKLWQARFDDSAHRSIWLNEAATPSQKTLIVDTNQQNAVALSLAFSTRMAPCAAWWDRAARVDIYWYNDRTRKYQSSAVKGEYPILLQSDIENMFYGHSFLVLLCLIEGRLHYYHEMDNFTKPVLVLPDTSWYCLQKAGMATGRRLGIVGEVYEYS